VSWVGFASGYRVDLERLGRACRERGVFFVVDAIQGLGPLTLDVSRLDIDVLACGAQKWLLAPWGAGFVYVREELARTLPPPIVSWMAARGTDDFRRLTEYDFTWRDDARRYEFVTLPFQDFAGLNASLELFVELGPSAISAHIIALADLVIDWAVARGIDVVTPSEKSRRAGIACIKPQDAAGASARLKERGVVHSYREGAIRLAPHVYNDVDDVRAALELIAP
jgi:cysteine desulfurase / selenocysteine lyase